MIIDGKTLAEKMKQDIKEKNLKAGLAVILAGDDPASQVYVKNKVKACEQVGFESSIFNNVDVIEELNERADVHGILVQLPLPKHLDEKEVLSRIDPKKDVDGFLPNSCFDSCTPLGIIELIKSTGQSMEGKHAVVVGRSNIVGKPVATLLLNENCTVTICHSKTKNLKKITKQADILVAAIGKKHFITADMVKKGSIVIDVGINREDGKIYGDVDFENVKDIAGFITPVPGGVGPMTIAMLLRNTLVAAQKINRNFNFK